MGPPAQIVQAVLQHRVVPVMSTVTFAELKSVVRRPKLQPAFARAGVDIENFLTTVRTETQFVQPISTSVRIRDERDRPFLDVMATLPPPLYFVTGDKDFEAPHYSDVPVISAVAFVRLLKRR
jgi:putative PIN family toxin of toxin-antitoxin system